MITYYNALLNHFSDPIENISNIFSLINIGGPRVVSVGECGRRTVTNGRGACRKDITACLVDDVETAPAAQECDAWAPTLSSGVAGAQSVSDGRECNDDFEYGPQILPMELQPTPAQNQDCEDIFRFGSAAESKSLETPPIQENMDLFDVFSIDLNSVGTISNDEISNLLADPCI